MKTRLKTHKLEEDDILNLIILYEYNVPVKEISKYIGIHQATTHRKINELNLKRPKIEDILKKEKK